MKRIHSESFGNTKDYPSLNYLKREIYNCDNYNKVINKVGVICTKYNSTVKTLLMNLPEDILPKFLLLNKNDFVIKLNDSALPEKIKHHLASYFLEVYKNNIKELSSASVIKNIDLIRSKYQNSGRICKRGREIFEGSIIKTERYNSRITNQRKLFNCVFSKDGVFGAYMTLHEESKNVKVFKPLSYFKKIIVIGHAEEYRHCLGDPNCKGNLSEVLK